MVKITYYYYRGYDFGSKHPHGDLQAVVTSVPVNHSPYFALFRCQTIMYCTQIHARKYTHKIKKNQDRDIPYSMWRILPEIVISNISVKWTLRCQVWKAQEHAAFLRSRVATVTGKLSLRKIRCCQPWLWGRIISEVWRKPLFKS